MPMMRIAAQVHARELTACQLAKYLPIFRAGRWTDHARRSLHQHALQKLDLFGQGRVLGGERVDLAHRMQHGRVVAPAEAPADLGQRAQRQRLRKIHGDLARAHDIGGAARGQDVGAADVEMGRDQLLDVLDLDPLRLMRADQIPDRELGRLDAERRAVQRGVREQTIDGAVEVAAVGLDGAGDIGGDGGRHVEIGMDEFGGGDARLRGF